MPNDQQPPWRALRRLHSESRGEGIVSRVTRSTAMAESFRANYGWHNNPPIVRPTPLPHNTPHLDRSEPSYLPIRRVEFPLFEIASSPTISLAAIRERRFDLIDGERHQPAKVPEIERLLKGLVQAFRRPRYVPPPRPELPRRSRWEVLAT